MGGEHVALVIGGGRGIGAAIARSLGRAGAMVFIGYHERRDAAEVTANSVMELGAKECRCVKVDARVAADVEAVMSQIEMKCGYLSSLVNCAHRPMELLRFSDLDWHAVAEQIAGTLETAFRCCQHALPLMRRAAHAAIVNLSSVTVARPETGYLHRNVAKAALEEFTRCLARELTRDRIRVNALSVGWTSTDQVRALDQDEVQRQISAIPLRRLARPDEIAETACFLLSQKASYINGVVLPVDGGVDGVVR